jgi:hypothetical protein
MAVGLPLKTTYANGDVYSASDVNDTNGTLNLLNPTAKGSLVSASAANTPSRLAVGTDGQVLVADSTATTGLKWGTAASGAPYVAGKNAIINGGADIWQRGTSIAQAAASQVYTADRWNSLVGASTASTISRQVTGDTTNLPNIQYCVRVQRNSGQTGTGVMYFANSLETVNSIPFTGQAVTVSFYARKGANYSPTSSALAVYLWNGTGTDQQVNSSYTGANIVGSVTATLTTTWQRFTFTGTVPTNSTELAIQAQMTPTGTAGAADYYEITGVQLEQGSSATTFSRAGATIQGELAACQRYYYRTTAPTSGNGSISFGTAYSTTAVFIPFSYPVTMRATPTALEYSATQVNDGATGINANTMGLANATASGTLINITALSAAVTQFRPYLFIATTNGYIGVSAEL